MTYDRLPGARLGLEESVRTHVEVDIKYEGYVRRQLEEVERSRGTEDTVIPAGFDYGGVLGLRTEARQKLGALRPSTLGQALRISGITPTDVSLVMVGMRRCRIEF
jgi:tRNA uridine 5-carboxymethylaminomethyl modification enzyme